MIQTDLHDIYDVTLELKTPVFIGSGKIINKKEYSLDQSAGRVSILDMPAFMKLVVKKGLIDQYEDFILNSKNKEGLFAFLRDHFTPDEIKSLVKYECEAKNIYSKERSLLEIYQFIRMADNRPYIPGSSLKGAIRTCLLADMIMRDRKEAQANLNLINRTAAIKSAETIESIYLNLLNKNPKNRNDAVNSIMRSISVSDSEPIDTSSMTLCQKIDVLPNGTQSKINVLRECIKPKTTVKFKLSIERSYGYFNIETIKKSIKSFWEFYGENFLSKFKLPGDESVYKNDMLILGGGTGFFSKTIVYQSTDYDSAIKQLVRYFENKKDIPRSHKHYLDVEMNISPHTMKYTEYGRNLVPMGICAVHFN